METVSKKRGRPPKFDPEWVSFLRSLYPDLTTERQLIAKCYEITALGALKVSDGVLADGVANIVTTTSTYKATILEQLGRLKDETEIDDADILAAARWLSSRFDADPEFTVRKAVVLLRELREEIAGRVAFGWYHGDPGKLLDLLVASE